MKILSNLFDGIIVFISPSVHLVTADFGRLLAQHSAVVSLCINERVNYYICDEFDGSYESSGASKYAIKKISESFFLDSIAIGSLRLEKSYLVHVLSKSTQKRTVDSSSSSSSIVTTQNKKKTTKKLLTPSVDKLCPNREDYKVVFHNGVFWDCALSLTSIANNNNKYYIIQLLESEDGDYFVWNRWGRQGYPGQSKLFDEPGLAQAKHTFEQKFHQKTANVWHAGRKGYHPVPGKYTWIELDLEEDEDEADQPGSSHTRPAPKQPAKSTSLTLAKPSGSASVCSLDPRVADLVQMIFDNSMMAKTVAAMNYDVKKQPLGKLSKSTIKKALGVLKEIEDVLTSGKYSQAKISDCSNRFYTLIPHSSGKTRLPYIDNLVILEEKLNLLDTLNEIDEAEKLKKQDISTGDTSIHPLDRQYSQLNLSLKPVEKNTPLFAILEKYVVQTHAPTHTDYKLKILDIFEVKRPQDDKHFVEYEDLHNQQLLWHGSRMSNWVGIMSQGLRIAPPEAPVTGYMFGKGVYFADLVSKSANYCATSKSEPIGFLMACQVALGDSYERTAADYIKKLPPKYQSCKGVGLTEPDPKETVTLDDGVQVPLGKPVPNPNIAHSDLLYNEYIVYDIAQIKFRYLYKFQFQYY